MSSAKCAWPVTYTLTPPPSPAGTTAELETVPPAKAFNVETSGLGCPVGKIVRKGITLVGRAVTVNEYALAVGGMPQAPDAGMKVRVSFPAIIGGPKEPAGDWLGRVSTKWQGVTGMK